MPCFDIVAYLYLLQTLKLQDMKIKFNFKMIVLIFIGIIFSISSFAQYTIAGYDVSMTDGYIQECHYLGGDSHIIIPDELSLQTVVGIADEYTDDGAFANMGLVQVELPSTMEDIGEYAFWGNNIDNVNFGDCPNLERIGVGAFSNNNLDLVNLSTCTSLYRIGAYAFNSNNMSGFSLPINAEYSAFGWVDNNGNVYDAGDYVTDMAAEYWIPVTYTIQDADVTIVDGIITEFNYNYAETSITIPETLQGQTVIGIADDDTEGVFESKGITEINFPSTIQIIGDRAFKENVITVVDLNVCTQLSRIGKNAFESNEIGELILNSAETLTIIDDKAFYQNELGDIDISDYTALEEIGTYAFSDNFNGYYNSLDLSNCTSLTTIGASAFLESYLNEVSFEGCTSLQTIGYTAFYQNVITELDFSSLSSLEIIGTGAFQNNQLTSVNFENCTKLYNIGYWAFSDNADLTQFLLPDDPNLSLYYWRDSEELEYDGGDIINDFGKKYVMPVYTLKDEDVVVVEGYITECLIDFPIEETHLDIPEVLDGQPVWGIADGDSNGVFENKGIFRLRYPSTIKKFGNYAFRENKIQLVALGYSDLLQVGVEAFADNEITTLSISTNSLTVIDEYAFYGNLLTAVDFNSATGLRVIGDFAFAANDIDMLMINNASGLQYIGEYAFAVNAITNFVLPTPDIPGYNLNHWAGTNTSTYAGGATVSNLNIGYLANLTATGNSVTFAVTDGSNPIEGAYVSLEMHGTRQTNTAGVAVFESVDDGDYDYTINAYNFDENIGVVTVSSAPISEDVTLNQSTYDVKLSLFDGLNPISGVVLTFNGTEYISGSTGLVWIENVSTGTYNYSISDESYLSITGEIEVVAVEVEDEISLTRIYSVNFTVTDGTNPIEGANVSFDDLDYYTNASGQVSITELAQGAFSYTVSADGYLAVSDELNVTDDDISLTVELEIVYTLTFNVTDGASPIFEAIVVFDDVDYSCDEDGQLVLVDVFPGTYSYSVTLDGYTTVTGSVTVDLNETIDVVLDFVYQVEFYISDGTQPVENASVLFDGETYYSNVAGFVTIENVPEGDYAYQINATDFQPLMGNLTVSDDDVSEIVTLNPVGVDQMSLQNISVYPNPTLGQINFDGIDSTITVEIYNAVGQIVLRKVENTNFSIDMSEYDAGVYSVRLLSENSNIVVVKRIIKE